MFLPLYFQVQATESGYEVSRQDGKSFKVTWSKIPVQSITFDNPQDAERQMMIMDLMEIPKND